MNIKQLLKTREEAKKLYDLREFESALEEYKRISDAENKESNTNIKIITYESKFNIACIYEELKKVSEAKEIYHDLICKFKSMTNPDLKKEIMELYSKSLINLANIKLNEKEIIEAAEIYNLVEKRCSIDCYSNSRIQLGNISYLLGDKEKAIRYYSQVKKGDSLRQFSRSQYFLGLIAQDDNDLLNALNFYNNVSDESLNDIYFDAKIRAGKINYFFNEYDEARNSFLMLTKNCGIEFVSEASYYLGKMSESISEKYDFFKKIDATSKKIEDLKYEINLVEEIFLLKRDTSKKTLNEILDIIDDILKKLFISSNSESCLAHYTNLTVSKILLNSEDNLSNLRLNTINLMNDPKEGELLFNILNINEILNSSDLAFISCFTLHHDSLNQFRLYAKEAHQEATGLSLVLSKKFFSSSHNISKVIDIKNLMKEELNIDGNIKEGLNINIVSDKTYFPVYRCVYFDPISGLIKVAQREEWSLYREYKLNDKFKWSEENKVANTKWENYSKEIFAIESNVKKSLKKLFIKVEELNVSDLQEEERNLFAEIILPLRYLIKHMAFKEEQECRIVYVTKLDNAKVKYDANINRIYVNYEPSIIEYLEKIYIAPKAKDEKMIFEYLCSRGQKIRGNRPPVKIKISQNPFR